MSRDLMRRIVKLEGMVNTPPDNNKGPTLILIRGGLAREPIHATVGGMRVARAPSEPLNSFCDRCREIAAEANEAVIIVGGLPPADEALSELIEVPDELPDPFDCSR